MIADVQKIQMEHSMSMDYHDNTIPDEILFSKAFTG
jgi:hypothetical protein